MGAGETFGPGAPLAILEEGGGGAPARALEPESERPALVPFTGIRGAVAREMASAWRQPRVAVGVQVDMTAALAAAGELSPTYAVLRAVALALREHPRLNARVVDEGVELAAAVNLGLAVNLDEGVIVPVIRDADRKPMQELATEAGGLAAAARDGSLPGTALRDGTFTVSNLGAAGIDWFTPILNSPQVAILGMGRVVERVLARDGAAVVAPTVDLTLVFDHRALDGQPASLFLAALRDRLERADL